MNLRPQVKKYADQLLVHCTLSQAGACPGDSEFVPGDDGEKTRDDTACAVCKDGEYKSVRLAACVPKRDVCPAGKYFRHVFPLAPFRAMGKYRPCGLDRRYAGAA